MSQFDPIQDSSEDPSQDPSDDPNHDPTDPGATTGEVPGAHVPPPPPSAWPPAPPQGDGSAGSDQRNWAMGSHLSSLALVLLGGLAVLGPLVVWLVKKDDDAFVAAHARESLNFQLTWFIGGIVGGIAAFLLAVVTLGFGLLVLVPIGIGLMIAWLVFVIKATIAASNGEHYRYPLSVRLIS